MRKSFALTRNKQHAVWTCRPNDCVTIGNMPSVRRYRLYDDCTTAQTTALNLNENNWV